MPVRILIADDHAVIQEGLKMILEARGDMHVIGTADNGRAAISKAQELRPEIIVMDIAMPELNGIEATCSIHENLPGAKVIILSMHNSLEHVYRPMMAGAHGYVLKECASTEIVRAVYAVTKGLHYYGKGVEKPQAKHYEGNLPICKSPLDSLSRREREVLQLVVEGKTSLQIAGTLSLSPKSVETYRSRLMIKLGIDNLPSLVKFALLHGITSHC